MKAHVPVAMNSAAERSVLWQPGWLSRSSIRSDRGRQKMADGHASNASAWNEEVKLGVLHSQMVHRRQRSKTPWVPLPL